MGSVVPFQVRRASGATRTTNEYFEGARIVILPVVQMVRASQQAPRETEPAAEQR